MSKTISADLFRDTINKSGLVEAGKLDRLLYDLAQDGIDVDSSKALADAMVDNNALTSWQVKHLLKGKSQGFLIRANRLLKPLGKGAMGTVYLAEHQKLHRQCAIKILFDKYVKKKTSVLERFYAEAESFASLDHVNIMRVYDIDRDIRNAGDKHY
ncbi:MAG: protein kinase, partial [Planctomycetales bacterium]